MCGPQPLTQRMPRHQVAQLPGEQGVLAQLQPGLGVLFHGGQALLLQPGDRRPGELLVGEVGERRAPPQGQRVGQQRGPRPQVLRRLGPPGSSMNRRASTASAATCSK